MSLKTEIRIFESTIIPVLTHRAQTWATIKNQIQKMRVTQNLILRNTLEIRLKDRVRIQSIMTKTNAKAVWVTAKRLKLKFVGHLIRDSGLKWCRILRPGSEEGRPIKWFDELAQIFGSNWLRIAKDHKQWKYVAEA